jgi:DNA-binding transcriptional regulator YiaG
MTSPDVTDWPRHIRRFRSRHGLSRAELAHQLEGIPPRTVESWENAERTPPPYLKLALQVVAAKIATRRSRKDEAG